MTCRVIADFNFKDGEIGKILGIGESANGFQVTKDFKGCLGIDVSIDMDNPNRMILTETWKNRDDHAQYMKFRESEGPDGFLAKIISVLDADPKFVWVEVKGSWDK